MIVCYTFVFFFLYMYDKTKFVNIHIKELCSPQVFSCADLFLIILHDQCAKFIA
jgi:hypothetical protein